MRLVLGCVPDGGAAEQRGLIPAQRILQVIGVQCPIQPRRERRVRRGTRVPLQYLIHNSHDLSLQVSRIRLFEHRSVRATSISHCVDRLNSGIQSIEMTSCRKEACLFQRLPVPEQQS